MRKRDVSSARPLRVVLRAAALTAAALCAAPGSASAGARPQDSYFDSQIANAKATINACIDAIEGNPPSAGCSDVALVYMPAFMPRVIAPIFADVDLSKLEATLNTVQNSFAQAASQLQALDSNLATAMTIPSRVQLAGDLQGQVQSAFQSVDAATGALGALIDLYNIDSQRPLAGKRYGGAMIPYGALDTLALATATQKIYDALYDFGICASGTLTGYAAEPAGGVGCTTPQYGGLLSIGIRIGLTTSWSAGNRGYPKIALSGKPGAQSLSVDFDNALTADATLQFDIYPPDPWPNQSPSGKVQATVHGQAHVSDISLDPIDADQLVTKDGLNSSHVGYTVTVNYDLGGIDQILSQTLTDLYADLAPVVGALGGPIGVAVLGTDAISFHSKADDLINNAVKPAINEAIATAKDDLKTTIEGYVRKNYATIDSFNKDALIAQSLLAAVQKSYTSTVFPNGSPRIEWATQLFDGQIEWFDAGTNTSYPSPSQELSSAFELVMPGPQDSKGSLAATLLLPQTVCNYDVRDMPHTGGVPGPSIPYDMVSYSPGPAPAPGTVPQGGGAVAVNADAVGKPCQDLLKANLIVTRYKGSRIVQIHGLPQSRIRAGLGACEWLLRPRLDGGEARKIRRDADLRLQFRTDEPADRRGRQTRACASCGLLRSLAFDADVDEQPGRRESRRRRANGICQGRRCDRRALERPARRSVPHRDRDAQCACALRVDPFLDQPLAQRTERLDRDEPAELAVTDAPGREWTFDPRRARRAPIRLCPRPAERVRSGQGVRVVQNPDQPRCPQRVARDGLGRNARKRRPIRRRLTV